MKYQPPVAEKGDKALPFKIKDGTIREVRDGNKTSDGKITFDTKAGRLIASEIKVKMTGNLTLEINDTTTEVALTQEQTTTIKTSDRRLIPMPKR